MSLQKGIGWSWGLPLFLPFKVDQKRGIQNHGMSGGASLAFKASIASRSLSEKTDSPEIKDASKSRPLGPLPGIEARSTTSVKESIRESLHLFRLELNHAGMISMGLISMGQPHLSHSMGLISMGQPYLSQGQHPLDYQADFYSRARFLSYPRSMGVLKF